MLAVVGEVDGADDARRLEARLSEKSGRVISVEPLAFTERPVAHGAEPIGRRHRRRSLYLGEWAVLVLAQTIMATTRGDKRLA